MLLSVLSDDIDCVEFHCNSSDIEQILENWKQLKNIYSGRIGFCMDRSKLPDETIISLISQMVDNDENVIVQTDGKPMSGGTDDYKSNIQAVSFAELILSNNIHAKIVLSGGTNSKTSEFAKLCNVDIDGVAIGSFARKLVKDEISSPDFFENIELQNSAIEKARDLYNKINI
jgi:hypothetical protein